MIYDLSDDISVARARTRFDFFISRGKNIVMREMKKKRSFSQNRYLHMVLACFGKEFGYTTEEVKQDIFKKIVNREIFYEGEAEGIVTISRFRSTADLSKDEMIIAIDKFLKFSAEHGCRLPEPTDLTMLMQIEEELEQIQNKKYL